MEKPPTYCDYVLRPDADPLHRHYHDGEYGFPLDTDDDLFGRLVLEINQAGLSWLTVLKKKENFKAAFSRFDVRTVAHYGETERERLLNDTGIIRNRLKIDAVIHNAGRIVELQKQHGSFAHWLDQQGDLSREEWVRLFRKTFRFTGGEITGEFLMSTGYLEGAHRPDCPVYREILELKPRWGRFRQGLHPGQDSPG